MMNDLNSNRSGVDGEETTRYCHQARKARKEEFDQLAFSTLGNNLSHPPPCDPNVFLEWEDQEMEFGVESCSVCGVGREVD
jgi:hypothetical protein